MRFRQKVIVANLIMMSLATAIVGFLMIKRNFNLALNTLKESAIVENNLVQTYVEYGILDYISSERSKDDISKQLFEIGEKISGAFLSEKSDFVILYDDKKAYGEDDVEVIPKEILDIKSRISKNYIIDDKDGVHFMYVASCNELRDAYLQIVTITNVEEAYSLANEQLKYFRILLIVVLVSSGVIMYIYAAILTRPLVKLGRVSKEMTMGNYKMRAEVKSNDEVGQLARNFNEMASSVEKHVDDLRHQVINREQFVADFTHEIKTPLTSIIGYADTMRSFDLQREQQIESLNYIVSAGKRLRTMSGKLFELIYLNRNEIETGEIEMPKLAAEIADYVRPILDLKNITLEVNVSEGTIVGNKDLLVTAFSNFIDNSRKASKEGSVINLTGSKDGDKYILSVKDNGIGIKKENLDKITNEFFMEDKSRSRMEGSAGLGLSLAALIVKKHNAKLIIDSQKDVGTLVKVIFG